MTNVMMQIGDYRFSLDTAAYDQMSRKAGWRWAEMERVGRKPAMQYMGPDAQEIKLSGTILPAWRGGTGQIDDMRAEASKGEPLMLVDGRGNIWGRWVILSVEEKQSIFASHGVGRRVDFDMTIMEYGEDDLTPITVPEEGGDEGGGEEGAAPEPEAAP